MNEIITYTGIYPEEKVQFNAKCLLSDYGSPMEFKDCDGQLFSNLYYVEPFLDCDFLKEDDLTFYELIDNDEELSDSENGCRIFNSIGGDKFV